MNAKVSRIRSCFILQYHDILSQVKKLHFIGIGGSGMCPMAEILLQKGYTITGSDINESETLDRIRADGITVRMGHQSTSYRASTVSPENAVSFCA